MPVSPVLGGVGVRVYRNVTFESLSGTQHLYTSGAARGPRVRLITQDLWIVYIF